MILKFQPFEYYRKKDKFASFQNLQSKDFAEASRFPYLIDGSQNTENETSREQRRSRNFENRCNAIGFCHKLRVIETQMKRLRNWIIPGS